ncbi:hypothetical protein C8R44DRAFT_894844 [Mycena epipterygia]|nr:hypothetical protein C8R44DRAFT_894844 [Mycena epipterygia]
MAYTACENAWRDKTPRWTHRSPCRVDYPRVNGTLTQDFVKDTLAISDAAGNAPAFKGAFVEYSPRDRLRRERRQLHHCAHPRRVRWDHPRPSKTYNFTNSGASTYDIAPANKLQYVDPTTNTLVTIHADAAYTAALFGTLSVTHRSVSSTLGKRIAYQSCSTSEKSTLVSAAAQAQRYANAAVTYLTPNTASTTVLSHYTKMKADAYADYTYDVRCPPFSSPLPSSLSPFPLLLIFTYLLIHFAQCSCTDSDTYAYVYADEFGTIYLCGVFWDAPSTGTDSQGGALIHENSHFDVTAATQGYVYGQTAAKALAKSNTAEA